MEQRIIHGDCLQISPPDPGLVDLLLCDPPYRPHVHSAAHTQQGGEIRRNDLGFAHRTSELTAHIAEWSTRAQWACVYTDLESTGEWHSAIATHARSCVTASGKCRTTVWAPEDPDEDYLATLPWVRWSMPNFANVFPPQGAEAIIITRAKGQLWRGPKNLTHLAHKPLRGSDKHKTEKPLDQILDLVSWMTKPGGLVVDLTAGRGTTALACAILSRRCVSWEIDETEWRLGRARLERYLLRRELSDRDAERLAKWKQKPA